MKRCRGLVDLLRDGFFAGTGALERVQKESAAVPFAILESVPLLRGPARAVHEVHDATVSLIYASLRVAGQAVGRGLDEALAVIERSPTASSPRSSPARSART